MTCEHCGRPGASDPDHAGHEDAGLLSRAVAVLRRVADREEIEPYTEGAYRWRVCAGCGFESHHADDCELVAVLRAYDARVK